MQQWRQAWDQRAGIVGPESDGCHLSMGFCIHSLKSLAVAWGPSRRVRDIIDDQYGLTGFKCVSECLLAVSAKGRQTLQRVGPRLRFNLCHEASLLQLAHDVERLSNGCNCAFH